MNGIRDAQLEMIGILPSSIKPHSRPSWLNVETSSTERDSVEDEKETQKRREDEQIRAGYTARNVPRKAVDPSVLVLGGVEIKHPKEDSVEP